MVAAWISAEKVVGPAIASGSQSNSGNWTDLLGKRPEFADRCDWSKLGGWGWAAGEEDHVFSPEYLLDCYVRSVGRNSNLLVGMAISTEGDFQDEEQFIGFGRLLKKTFGTPALLLEKPQPTENRVTLCPDGETPMAYLSIREDIAQGQHIRAFRVLADGAEIASGHCIGHRRILPLGGIRFRKLSFVVEEAAGAYGIRDLALYAAAE